MKNPSKKIRFKGILTDMDGLLVDSETLGIRVAVEVCKDLGLGTLSEVEQQSFIGVTDKEFYQKIFVTKERHDLNVDALLATHFETYERMLPEVSPFPDEVDFLKRAFAAGVPIALISGSTRDQIAIILNAIGLVDVIPAEKRVGCDDYEHGKPSPEGYLQGAEKLGLATSECLVLEDATSGIRAGKAAGAKVIAVERKLPQDTSEADMLVSSLSNWIISGDGEYFLMREMP